MRWLMILLGVSLLVIGVVYAEVTWMAGIFVVSGLLSIISNWPIRFKWLAGFLGVVATILMFTMFAWFFHGIAVAHVVQNWFELDDAGKYASFLWGGLVLMVVVSEYSCWMKGRESCVAITFFDKSKSERSRMRRVAAD